MKRKARTVLEAALGYLGPMYVAGWTLGAIREMAMVPRVGRTASTAAEGALMATASYFAARRAVQRLGETGNGRRAAVGLTALAVLIPLELAGAKLFRGMSIQQYLASQRSPSGAIFAALLVWFATAPLAVKLEG